MTKQVTRRLLINSLLLLVVAVLVYFIWYQPAIDKRKMNNNQTLFSIAPYQVERINIQHSNHADVVLTKEKQQWVLEEPGIAPVNPDKVKHLLTILQEPVIASYDLQGKDLSVYGLNPGKIKLKIISTDYEEEATFGSTNAVTLNRYILKNNTIYTISEIVYGMLGSSVIQLLEHRLLPEYLDVVEIDAPELFKTLPLSFWKKREAKNLADYIGDETILGKIKVTVQYAKQDKTHASSSALIQPHAGENTEIISKKQVIEFHILEINPAMVLGRPDLKIKYSFNEGILKE